MSPLLPTPVNLRPATPARIGDLLWAYWGITLAAAASAVLLLVTSLGSRLGLVDTLLVWPMRWFQLLASLAVLLGVSLVLRTAIRVLRHLPATEIDVLPNELRVRRMLGLAPVLEHKLAVDGERVDMRATSWTTSVSAGSRRLLWRWRIRPDDAWVLREALRDRNRKIRASLLRVDVAPASPPADQEA